VSNSDARPSPAETSLPEAPPPPPRGWRIAFLVLCTIGACLSADLVRLHVNVHTDPAYQSYCAMSERVNCETVAASDWAVFGGLPVAVWGLLAYLAMAGLAIWGLRRRLRSPAWPFGILFWLGVVSSVVGLVLFAVSHFVIESVCLVCAATYAVDVALLVTAWGALRRVGVGPLHALGAELRSALAKPGPVLAFAGVGVVALVVLWLAVPPYWRVVAATGPEGLAVGETEAHLPWIGAREPVLTIIEFSDYQCPHCRRGHDDVRKLIRQDADRIRLVHRHFPLDHHCNDALKRPFHAHACHYALLAHCAGRQGRFWEANDLLYAEGHRKEPVTAADIAAAVGADAAKLQACAGGAEAAAAIQADLQAGRALRIRGTPTFVVGDQTYPGRVPDDVIAAKLGEPVAE